MSTTSQPHLTTVEAVRIAGDGPADRGRVRGALLRARIHATARGYVELFASLGISSADQREAATASLTALRDWDPAQHEEVTGIADGAGMALVDLGMTVARTEILTRAEAAPSECSTVAHQAAGSSVSAQTWDWYAGSIHCWHLHRVDRLAGELAHAGLTEYGMPGKIGMNAAGVGVHLNILKHRDDSPGGVPVHSVLTRVLTEAASVEDGIEIIRSAATTASSVLTLTSVDRVAMVEIAPGGISVLEADGWLLHTNHFLAGDRQDGAMLLDAASTTYDRLAYLEGTTGASDPPRNADDLVPLMCSPVEDGCVALLPDPSTPEVQRLATLVTVLMDPAGRRVQLSPGIPQFAGEASFTYQL
jgi:isopenicillin-N N-acyltransferase-like protein